ncbi:MAG TPA: sensor histidine kinase [Bacillus bacterium]|uniref:histidine kinase n=1 Tax=Siminovitchia fordii TaxID=254759 RepID=A0ABQ4K9N6_9BACI|nr:sensor histidine kinase [Siminovitchia fordii]GIN22435.1 sensor histidine kinase [Siminovitchia fordii]HBZ11973.1 sensor histidine kinase [Bacillus sp. (in: firmicutes)]
MIHKIYPREQISNYLLIDTFAAVLLTFMVLTSESTTPLMMKLLLLLLFFFSFYIALWFRDWRLLTAMTLGCFSLSLLCIFTEQSIFLFGFIFADLLGRANEKLHIGIGMLAIATMFVIVQWHETGSLISMKSSIFLPVVILQLLLPVIIYIREKAKTLEGELDTANQQIERYIQEEERHRIARDLHDTLGQTLTMIKLKSELAILLVDQDEQQAKAELNDILESSRVALKQVRELVTGMKFISLEEEIARSRDLLKEANIESNVEGKGQRLLMPSVDETMLALSLREAVTNIIRHSGARKCNIRLETDESYFKILIRDDGVGLMDQSSGNGIQSMKERLQTLKGTAEIANASDGGTVVTLALPINSYEKEKSVL